MNARFLTIGALGLLAASAIAAEMPWAKDFKSAQAAASKSNKLIMLDFYTDW